jgi:diguanylate cyclase (GGDEF)-like protein
MKNFRLWLNSKLARRTVVYVFLLSSTVTLCFTSLQLYLEYRNGIASIHREIEQIAGTSLKPLAENLWLLNINSIHLMLEGIMHNQDIVYLAISDETGKIVAAQGQQPESNYQVRTIPLSYTYQGREIYLGRLKIVATLKNVYTRLIDTITYILITQSVKTFLVSTFILFIVWLLISRHLSAIESYTNNLRLSRPQKDLELDRKKSRWTKNDEFTNLVAAINMMRREIYASYSHIEYLSLHDPLTGLPNRRFLEEQLGHATSRCARENRYGAVLFLDLDHFKLLNDSLGHSVGDQMLIAIAKRLSSAADGKDILVTRIGGDEFIILLCDLSTRADRAGRQARSFARTLQASISEHAIIIEEKRYKLTVSVGIALFGGNGCNGETILKQADLALHESKARGRDRITTFLPEMQRKVDLRLQTEQRLHAALKKEQFVVHFQPKFDRNGAVCSAEALMRWQLDSGEMIAPNVFIPVAEESGLIVEIGNQITSMIFCMTARNLDLFKASGLTTIAINVSPRQFTDPAFYKHILREADRYGLDPGFFILEITEEAVINDIEATREIMHRLKSHGFRLSIDDFGTGYSSLQYLKDFPLDELKIDKSFIDHIVDNKNDLAIALSIIEMAKNLNLDVVAEGVETQEQFELLININCHIFQGFYLSKPLREEDFLDLLATGDRTGAPQPECAAATC